jgi:cytochrome c oxidase subunit 2
LWFTVTKAGTYEVYCTEYCGLEHSLMRAVVVALEPDAYESWLHTTREAEEPVVTALEGEPSSGERITQPPPTLAASSMAHQGELLAARYGCLNCHTVDGRPHIGPSWAGLYGTTRPLDSDATVFADETYITRSMMDPTREVVRGFAPVMPSFQGLLGAAETSAIVEYIKSLRSGAPTPVIPPWTGTPPPVIGARP